jgi:deoxycytidylate deaminase
MVNAQDDDASVMTDQHPLLKDYQLHGWAPDSKLSDDENYIDLIMLLTRNSNCRQGHMACAVVRRRHPSCDDALDLLDRISTVANNTSVYKERDSDNHAEINALGEAAKFGRATDGCTAFITMPPCKRCFGALLAAGIARIVTTRTILEPIATVAEERGIETLVMDANASTNRIAKYLPKLNRELMEAGRAQQKQEKLDRQVAGKERKRKAQELDLQSDV